MAAIYLGLLRAMAATAGEDERQAFLFQHPALLAPGYQQALAGAIAGLPEGERAGLGSMLAYAEEVRAALEAAPQQYPIGPGPIEQLWLRYGRGELSAAYAETLARQPELAALLAPLYVRALSRFTVESAQSGNWRQAVQLQGLLLVAAGALPEGAEAEAMRQEAALAFVEIAQVALGHVPDGRLYRRARQAGEAVVARARVAQEDRLVGDMLHRLGTLHLDPYTAGRSSANYAQELQLWQQRLSDELGPELALIPEEEWRMPAPVEALRTAEQYLRQAIELRAGHDKGLTLKALVQTLEWLEVLGAPVDAAELIGLCHQALAWLAPDRDPQQRLAVLATLRRHDQAVDPAEVDKLFHTSLDQYVHWLGIARTTDLVHQAAAVLREDAPLRSLEILRSAHPLIRRSDSDTSRMAHWQAEINLIIQAFAPELPPRRPDGGLEAAAQHLRQRAGQERWDVRMLSAGLIALAAYSGAWNEEIGGLALLDEAAELAPLVADEHADALAFLRAVLLLGAGVNGVNARAWSPAIEAYTQAMRQYLDLGLSDPALDCLRRIDDLATRQDPQAAVQVVAGVAPLALRLETVLGEPATRLIQHLCKRTVATAVGRAANPNVLLFLWQVAKGLRFATALYAGSRDRRQEDEHGARLLAQIDRAEAALPAGSPELALAGQEALLDEDTLLTAYARRGEQQAGETPEERLANLQRSYDAHVSERLLSGVAGSEGLYLTTADVQAALDERTVLLNFYLGASPDGRIAVHVLAFTREEVRGPAVVHDFPDSQVRMGGGGQEVEVNPFAVTVQALRRELVHGWPGPLLVPWSAGETLAHDLRGYLGHFVEYLDELHAAGKDHLCMVPHGPLHYYPLHLLGEPGHPLAERWIVTYLPNLHLLVSRRGQPAARRYRSRTLTAAGLGFDAYNPLGLPPIPQSLRETRAVAAVFGTEPALDAQATKERLLEALVESRYVHLSTHGRHNVHAPAFQCLYLAPDGRSDGRLHAYELLSQDLRGLELLTLSACETALGRFDTGDNLRGLPAAFLLAGVATIVGTLWPAEVNASELFFTTLYRERSAGASRLDAFATAQRATRAAFARYRDWGPFYLIGDWD